MSQRWWIILSVVLALDLGMVSSLARAGPSLHVLDVGQGDAILLSSAEGHHVLIDGGPGTAVLTELPRVLPYLFSEIDLLVLTHPHLDHVEGLVPLVQRLDVGAVLLTLPDYSTAAYDTFLKNLEGIPIYLADDDNDFRLGDLSLDVLYPFEPISGEKMENVNNASVVIRAEFPVGLSGPIELGEAGGRTSILLMGDAEQEVESQLLAAGANLSANVLKAGHHGSRTSSTRAFLEAVQPELILISAGENNDYGHPHEETLNNAADLGFEVLRTDRDGRISLVFDSLDSKLGIETQIYSTMRSIFAPNWRSFSSNRS